MESNMVSNRMVWLDWMKVWAILAVIWGHFFSSGHLYLYVFNLQVFCVISGFLYKRAPNWKACLNKIFWQLLLPTLIMSLMIRLEVCVKCLARGEEYILSWPWFFRRLLLGRCWCMGPCWYFYTLTVMRLIMQILPEKKWVYAILFAVLSAGTIYLNHIGVVASNANLNVLVCMPFFLIGLFMKPLKSVLIGLHRYYTECAILLVSIALVFICGNFNGYVWMYHNDFGNNYALFLLGGIAGAGMLYIISLWLSRLPYKSMMLTLSRGSIMIIGLHIIIVRRLTGLSGRMWGEDLVMAVLILLLFVPLIRLAELFFPILLGRRN